MHIIIYLFIAAAALYISRMEKHINVPRLCIPIAIPLGIFTAIGAISVLYMFLNVGLAILAILFLILQKMRSTMREKIITIYASALIMLWGIAAGPSGLIALSILGILMVLITLSSAEKSFVSVYTFFFTKMAQVLARIRRTCNWQRSRLPLLLRFFVTAIEISIVCGLAVEGLWQLMNLLNGYGHISETELAFRLIAIIPFTGFLYQSYLRDTKTIRPAEKAMDIPLPVDLTTSITA